MFMIWTLVSGSTYHTELPAILLLFILFLFFFFFSPKEKQHISAAYPIVAFYESLRSVFSWIFKLDME